MKDIIVIKIGGVASANLTPAFFEQIKAWQEANKKIIIVHGGGHYISSMLERLAIPIKTKDGIRVTNEQTLEITKMVLIGQVQPLIMTAFQTQHIPAVGLNAGDSGIIFAKKTADPSLGLVGEVTAVQTEVIEHLLAADFVTIIAPLGITETFDWLNINADIAACQIATAMHAEQLFLLTDVAGVQVAGEVQAEITTKAITKWKEDGTIYGGMVPKLASAEAALQGGVEQVIITNHLANAGTTIKSEVTVS